MGSLMCGLVIVVLRFEVISHCGLNFHFLVIVMFNIFFIYLLSICMSSWEK